MHMVLLGCAAVLLLLLILGMGAVLEGTENRIAVERQRFNEAARHFITKRQSFPTVLIVGSFGDRCLGKAYFQAEPGSQQPPKVKF